VDEAFPSTLGKLQKLRSLTINGVGLNTLNGIGPSPPAGLPSFVGELTHLRELFAYEFTGNAATGAYPANLVKLQSLTSLTLGDFYSFGRYLNGSLPQFILSLKALQKLDLSRNNFSGRVWPNLGTLKNLRYIDLSDNSLSGSVGDVLSANPNWQTVILYAAGLGGVLPSGIGNLKKLRYLSLGLLLNGTIPPSFSKLTSLQYLAISSNNFYGAVPDLSATKLTYLSLASNNFTGALPRLPKTLQILAVGSNHFTSIPDTFKGLNSLVYADFSQAGAIRALPPSLFRLPKLAYLIATNLGLTSVPSTIGSAQALTSLDLSFNGIKQTFPAGVRALK
jgi:Leucine-rich repeat (LRR) protein